MDSYFFYQLEFKDKYFTEPHHRLTDEGEALVKQGIHQTWRNNEQHPKRNYAFYFKTRRAATKRLKWLPEEVRKHYKVKELMGLSCFTI